MFFEKYGKRRKLKLTQTCIEERSDELAGCEGI